MSKGKHIIPRYDYPKHTLEPFSVWSFINNWKLGSLTGWEVADMVRKELRSEGRISRSADRHFRMIKAYWLDLPVKIKRSGKNATWSWDFFREFLNSEFIQKRTYFHGVIEDVPDPDKVFRKAFKTLDEVYEYLKGSGLMVEKGVDEQGRIIWEVSTEYVNVIAQDGLFKVYIKSK